MASTLKIAATEDTPEITFENGVFMISGRSLPEDVTSFYAPVFTWLTELANSTAKATFKFKLEYFNTASSKILLDILMKLEDIAQANNNVVVEWHHSDGDDDMLEAGEEYKELVELPFTMVAF